MLNKIIALVSIVFVTSFFGGGVAYCETDESSASSETSTSVDTSDKNSTCQEKMAKYKASVACFAPFTLVNGAVKPEAFEHCTEVPQPDGCN